MKTNSKSTNQKKSTKQEKFTTYYKDIIWDPTIAYGMENELYEDACQTLVLGDILELDHSLISGLSGKPNQEDHQNLIRKLKLLKYTYLKEGLILWRIFKSYQWKITGAKNFKQYCPEYLHIPYWKVKNRINASAIASELIKSGYLELPDNEAQAAILTNLRNNPLGLEDFCFEYRLSDVWGEVLKLHPTKRTVKAIKYIIKEKYPDAIPPGKKRKITLDVELVEQIEYEAVRNTMTNSEFLNELMNDYLYRTYSRIEAVKVDMNPIINEVFIMEDFKKACLKFETNYLAVIKYLSEDQESLENYCQQTVLAIN